MHTALKNLWASVAIDAGAVLDRDRSGAGDLTLETSGLRPADRSRPLDLTLAGWGAAACDYMIDFACVSSTTHPLGATTPAGLSLATGPRGRRNHGGHTSRIVQTGEHMQAAGRLPMRCRSSAGPELYLPDRNSCAAYDSICQPASPTATDATPQLPDSLSTVVKQRCCRTQEGAGLLAGPAAAWRHREGGSWSHRQWRHGVKSHKHQRSAKAQHVAINQRIRAARSVGALLAVEQAEGLRALSPLNVDTLLARLQATAPRPGSAHAAHASSLLRRLTEYLTSGMAGYPAPTLVSCLQRLAALTPLPAMLLKAVEVEVGRRASRRQFRVSELTQLVRLGAAEAKRVAAQAKQAPPTADTAEHQVAPASHAAVVAAFLPAFAELERRLASSSVALPLESLVDMSRAYSAVAYHSLPLLGALEAALDAPVDLSSLEAATLVGVMHQLASTPGHSPELLSAIAGAVSARVGDLKPGELADAAHAAALAGDTSSSVAESGGLMAAIAARATAPRLYALDSEKLARLSVALAAAGQLTAAASITVQRCAVRQLEEFDAADLGRLLWAVAVSSGADAESGELFACAEGRLVSLVPLMDGNTLAGAAWAYAAVGQTAGRSLRRAIDERAVEMYNDVDCLERKMVTDALAAMVPPEECSH
eukprot:jgi/Tetstr1/456685/TSEL_043386.t1